MITCHECGHESNDSATDCANCGTYLQRLTRNATDEKAAAELDAMLDQLELPHEEAAASPDTRAGSGALANHAEAAAVEPADPLSSPQSPAIQMARVAAVVVVLVSMFAPWGRDGGVISDGWVFAIWFTLGSCGVLGVLYAGLLLYGLSVVREVSQDWVYWIPRNVRAFVPKGALEYVDRPWVFWLTRLALVFWLVLGPYFILSTNIRDWPLNITWGAKLFLVAIALANALEGLSLARWGRETSGRLWMAVGAIWICLSIVLLPLVTLITGIEYTPRRQLSAAEVLAQYQAGERSFPSANLQSAHLAEADLTEIELRHADLRGASLRSATLHNADLTQAYLSGADMSGADLSRADLSGARLSNTDLSRADLSEADLGGADLSNSDMAKIDLREANLSETKLFWADLSGADLSEADLSGANLRGANLTGARVTDEQFVQARSLEGATLPDGTVHE